MYFKKYFFGLLLFMGHGIPASAQTPPVIEWNKTFGGSRSETALAIDPTNDGGYIVAGITGSDDGDVDNNKGFSDAWIIKLDANGILVWEETYGGSNVDIAHDIQQTADGGYIVAGYTLSDDGDVSQNRGIRDIWVFKLNANGTLVWERTYGGSKGEQAYAIEQVADGGYVVTGYTTSSDGDVGQTNGVGAVWVLKLNANGSLVWEEVYGGSKGEEAHDIIQTSDKKYVVVGYSRSKDGDVSENKGFTDVWVFKIDTDGTLIWEKTYGGSSFDYSTLAGNDPLIKNDIIQQTADGGYVLSGCTYSTDGDVSRNQGALDIWVLKLKPDGSLDWGKTYGGTSIDTGGGVRQTPDGNYILGGHTFSDDGDVEKNSGENDFWLFKVDSLGNLLWEQTYGGPNAEYMNSMQQISGCEYIMAGMIRPGSHSDFLVMKFLFKTPPPVTDSLQIFCWSESPKIKDLQVKGADTLNLPITFRWYGKKTDVNNLSDNTLLEDGEKYYVSQTIDGCESPYDSTTVRITPDMPPQATSPQTFCEEENPKIFDITVTGQNLHWYRASNGNTEVSESTLLQDEKTYYISQSIDGCESSLTPVKVILKDCRDIPSSPFLICQGFSPNSDGINDFFFIGGIENYPGNNVKIFNRYGVLVFNKDNYDNTSVFFDGKNKELSTGVYFYVIGFDGENNPGKAKYTGWVYLNH